MAITVENSGDMVVLSTENSVVTESTMERESTGVGNAIAMAVNTVDITITAIRMRTTVTTIIRHTLTTVTAVQVVVLTGTAVVRQDGDMGQTTVAA